MITAALFVTALILPEFPQPYSPDECGFTATGLPVLDMVQAIDMCPDSPDPSDCRRLLARIVQATPHQAALAIDLEYCDSYRECTKLAELAGNTTGPEGCAFGAQDFWTCFAYGEGLDDVTTAAVCGAILL